MQRPDDAEVISMVLALEEIGQGRERRPAIGDHGLRFMLREAAKIIRKLRPDLNFTEKTDA